MASRQGTTDRQQVTSEDGYRTLSNRERSELRHTEGCHFTPCLGHMFALPLPQLAMLREGREGTCDAISRVSNTNHDLATCEILILVQCWSCRMSSHVTQLAGHELCGGRGGGVRCQALTWMKDYRYAVPNLVQVTSWRLSLCVPSGHIGSEGLAPLFPNFGAKWKWGVSCTPCPV